MKRLPKSLAILLLCVITNASALGEVKNRTWTALDGRAITAQIVSADDLTVKIRRTDGQQFTLKIEQLSEADQQYITSYLNEKKAASRNFKEGPYAEAIKGEWIKFPKEKHGLVFQIFASKKLSREKEPVPLFIHLHGAGARADDVKTGRVEVAASTLASEKQYKETPCVIIVPLCPTDSGWGKHVTELEAIIDSLVESLPINQNRIYLSGYSMGARGVDSLLKSRPKFYAAAMFADGDANRKWVDITDTPLWLCYSSERDAKKAEEVVDAYKAAGKKAHFQSFPQATHGQIHWKLAKGKEIFPWMFKQVRKSSEK